MARKIFETALYSILVTTMLSVAGARHASAANVAYPFTCTQLFRSSLGKTANIVKRAQEQVAIEHQPTDEIGQMELVRFERAQTMSDTEFAKLSNPTSTRMDGTVATLVAKGKSLEEAVKDLFGGWDGDWQSRVADFDERGEVNLARLPRVQLSLENGRQKLDFARIHFTKRDSALADQVLADYLALAEKYRELKILIVTDRDDLEAKLRLVSSSVRNRITIERTSSDLWIWAQDGSKPVDLPRTTAEFGQGRYTEQTKELESRAVLSAIPVSVPGWPSGVFQGGDIIVGDHAVFVGEAELHYVVMAFHETDAGALRILSSIFGKPALPAHIRSHIYGGNEWSFHIDLDMVVAVDRHTNKEVVLVNSPEALLNSLSKLKLAKGALTNEAVARVQKRIVKRYARGDFGTTLSTGSREFLLRLSKISPEDLRTEIYKGRLFKRLISSYGYETRDLPGFGNAQGLGQSMFFGTNAVLTEGLAIVPGNRMPELDRLIRTEYEKLGYDVVQMQSSARTICQQGGLRCVTETYRKPYLISNSNSSTAQRSLRP